MRETTTGLRRTGAAPFAMAVLLAAAALAACDKQPLPETAAPAPVATGAEMPGIPASGADLSVPSASAVLSGAPGSSGTPTADGNGPNQRSTVTNAQEKQSMPLPGQANDHSNTVTEDKKPASAASR